MFRKKGKENNLPRAKSDCPFFQSPKKESMDSLGKLMKIGRQNEALAPGKVEPFHLSRTNFNSPRKKFFPEHERTVSNKTNATIIDQLQREDIHFHYKKMKKILHQENQNLHNQKVFLLGQEQKIQNENAQLKQRIKIMEKRIEDMQESHKKQQEGNPLEKYINTKKRRIENAETADSDYFRLV